MVPVVLEDLKIDGLVGLSTDQSSRIIQSRQFVIGAGVNSGVIQLPHPIVLGDPLQHGLAFGE